MKIIVTGSLGHISRPLTQELIGKGHTVTIISSKPERRKEIEALGAIPAIGTLEDADFLATTFTGADAVYCMIPPNYYFDPEADIIAYCERVGNNYAHAIRQSGVKRVVHLSSIGAHMNKDSGLIMGHRNVEYILKGLPGIDITYMRPVAFYYNLYAFMSRIKQEGIIASNYGGDDRLPWVAPADIAAAVAEEIEIPLSGSKVRYVASDEPSCNEIAAALGAATGIPGLKWIVIPDGQMQQALEANGIPAQTAAGLVEMNAAIHSGTLQEDYYRNRPAAMGKIKITDFAQEFAAAFKQL